MKISFIIIMTILLSPTVRAQVNCVIDRPIFERTVTLQGADITVGYDVPVGSVLYSGQISSQDEPKGIAAMTCRYDPKSGDSFVYEHYSRLIGGGMEINSGIYATSLPGVGVRFYNNLSVGDRYSPLSQSDTRLSYSKTYPSNSPCDSTVSICRMSASVSFRFQLVKTGDIGAGQINGSNFPRLSITASSPTAGASVQAGEVASVTFNGSINVKSATCQTPGDFTVMLGNYEIRDIKAKKSSPWVDATIRLTGCPRFSGMPGTNSTSWIYPSSVPNKTAENNNNLLEVTLTPLTAVRNVDEGTFAIEQKPESASGVDIQLRRGTEGNNTSLVLKQPYTINIANDGQSILDVPLVARYVRNTEPLSPGIANGKVVYLINYK